MATKKKTQPCGFEEIKEGFRDVLMIHCQGCGYSPSIEDSNVCMSRTIDKLVQVPSAQGIIFSSRRNYVYDFEQTQLLMEIAQMYSHLIKQKRMLSMQTIGGSERDLPKKHAVIQSIVMHLMRSDPVGAYVELKRVIRDEKIKLEKMVDILESEAQAGYIDLLVYIHDLLDKTRLIDLSKPYLVGHIVGSSTGYRNLFRASITHYCMDTRLMMQAPLYGRELAG